MRTLAGAACVALATLAGTVLVPRAAGAQATSRRAWLGVSLTPRPGGGVMAKHVINHSPAAKAGLADGDHILLADGVSLDEPSQLIARVALLGPGNLLGLKIRHGNVERTVTASLIPFPGAEEILRLDKLGTFAPPWKTAVAVAGSLPSNALGRVVLVDFWASWCGPCRMLAPKLSQLSSRYGAQGLTVLGFTSEPVNLAAQEAHAMGMTYPIGSDPGDVVATSYGVSALPTLFLIDKKGVIRDVFVGFEANRVRDLERNVQALLDEPPPSP